MRTGSRRRSHPSGGFAYLGVLALVAVMGIMMSRAGGLGAVGARREREAQLLFAGDQIVQAIGRYYREGPQAGCHPPDLDTLVTGRYLRRRYFDPMTGSFDWGVIRDAQGNVRGVYSRSQRAPLRHAGFASDYRGFSTAARYRDWRFEHRAHGAAASAAACMRSLKRLGDANPASTGQSNYLSTE